MIDPFDAALSAFIDALPEDARAAGQLLSESAPFSGQGDLPELAELATMLRSVPAYEPRPEWMAASKARLMAAPLLPLEKRGFTWLGTMFLPLTQLSFPSLSLPQLSMPSPAFARAAVAFGLILALASVAHNHSARSPILQVTSDQATTDSAAEAIAATQQEMARLAESQVAGVEVQGTPRDVVLLSKRIDLAELAIEQAPAADQPKLRAQLQSAVRAVRFDGLLEGITNGDTLQVSGVAVQAEPSTTSQLQVGQPVSLLVTVGSNGKLQVVQVTPQTPPAPAAVDPASSPQPAPSMAPPPPTTGGGTAPQSSSATTETAAGASSPAVSSSANTDNATASEPQAHPARGHRGYTQRVPATTSATVASLAPAPASPAASTAPAVVAAAAKPAADDPQTPAAAALAATTAPAAPATTVSNASSSKGSTEATAGSPASTSSSANSSASGGHGSSSAKTSTSSPGPGSNSAKVLQVSSNVASGPAAQSSSESSKGVAPGNAKSKDKS